MQDSIKVAFQGDPITGIWDFIILVFWNYNFLIMMLIVMLVMEGIKLLICDNPKSTWVMPAQFKKYLSFILCLIVVFLSKEFDWGDWRDNVIVYLLNIFGLFVLYNIVFKGFFRMLRKKAGKWIFGMTDNG